MFDGIIMNPPYIRHEKIDELAEYGVTKAKLSAKSIFSMLPKSANLYMYFIVKAINLLNKNGELIVIFPDSWLNSRSGAAFRKVLLKNCAVEKRVHVTGRAFEKDALVDVVILKLKKNSTPTDCEPLFVRVEDDLITKRTIKQFGQNIKSKIPFHDCATIKRGITTGYNEAFINPTISELNDDYFEDIISSPKAVVGYSTKGASVDKLLYVKEDMEIAQPLREYLNNMEVNIVESQKPKTLASKIKTGCNWYSIKAFDCTGILFGYIVRGDMRFILNDTGVVARDNFYVIKPKIDKYILLAILNNFYVYMQLESIGRKYGGGMLKLQKYDVESIMFPNITEFSEKDIGKLSKLGKKLAETGNRGIIEEISLLLSNYESTDLETIKNQLDYMRSARLEK